MSRHALFLQWLRDFDHFAFGADHANVARASLHRPAQNTHIVAMAPSNDHNVRSLVGFELRECFVEIENMHFASGGKAFLGRIGGAVIRYNKFKTSIGCNLAKVDGNVTCAEYIK